MFITSDLLAAIAALSQIYPGAWFWLDAVSIDQASLAEKSVQVASMGRTYKQAEKTVVWLGQEFAEDTASRDHPPGVQEPAVYGLTVASLRNLVRRSDRVWWRRTGVVQEMMLARNLEVVVGARAISWADFRSSFETVYTKGSEDTSVLEATDLACTDTHINRLVGQALNIVVELSALRITYPKHREMFLLTLLSFTLHTRCSDPRDKIYALLGLAEAQERSNIKVDYTLSTAQVFSSVARYLAAMHPGDILQDGWARQAGLPYDPMDEASLPSWVPDYSFEMGMGPSDVPALQLGVFDERTITAWDDVQPYELHLEGLMFDQVEGIFYIRKEDLESFPHGKVMGLDELSRHVPPILRRHLPLTEPRHHIDRSAAFLNTVPLQRPAEGKDHCILPQPPGVLEYLGSPPTVPPSPEEGSKKPASHRAEIYREFELTMSGAALFTTALGFFGLGPTFMRPGDCVAVLFGGQTPFVLRPIGKPGEYTFVGQCYVHGIMDGELIKLLDQDLLETSWFVLV
ncbi:hypothetical protein LTR97_012465 [Elasticomyces elasticus]|uniref:Heterokaryon incompatibility domain-containing protein n=1 Tax=Elasticomyces elasticus TaxID=574655 RepID=A0AAN7VZL4_9PEZI|nr:hypothetical protein LTR97_012465 [Elasticomyces elasticus]